MTEQESTLVADLSPDQEAFVSITETDARDLSSLIESADSSLQANAVDCIVTSPPYWQKRDYGIPDQIGQENTPEKYVDTIVQCLDEWRTVLKPSGSVFLNIGDTYRDKSLLGIPGQIARAAREDGWLIQTEFIWTKSGGMPDPATDRLPQRSESIYHLTQSPDYHSDSFEYSKQFVSGGPLGHSVGQDHGTLAIEQVPLIPTTIVEQADRDLLADLLATVYNPTPSNIWQIDYDRNTDGHLAPFPQELAERALSLGCPTATCSQCGEPLSRETQISTQRDSDRDQARQATTLYHQSELTEQHIRAVQAVNIVGAHAILTAHDDDSHTATPVERLAIEAKQVLGEQFHAFTAPYKETLGWSRGECNCGCDADTQPGVAFDPFVGTGTTIDAAAQMGLSSIGLDLDPPETVQLPLGLTQVRFNT